MKIFITGATGLIGSHLIDYLLTFQDYDLYAIKRPRTDAYRPDKVTYYDSDITDPIGLLTVLKDVKPDVVYHLSAQSYPKLGFDNPIYTVNVNITGTINLLEAIRQLDYVPKKIIIACSGAGYGKVSEYPTKEDELFNPLSLYGVTKATQDLIGYQYFENYGLPIIRTRSYIHVGARQNDNNAINSFAKQIALIESGKKDFLDVGNLSTERDILDVRDAVRAFKLLAEHGVDGEAYNICSQTPRKMKDILLELLTFSKVKNVIINISKNKLRPSDLPLELGSYEKLNELTGWRPEIPFSQTLEDILNYWRDKVG